MGDCAWVTQVLEDESLEKALVLGRSLRKNLTRHKLVCIVRPSIPLNFRDALEATFDFVLSLDNGKCCYLDEMKISPNLLAKCFAMSFTFFKQCLYVPPNSLALKNCDEIFDEDQRSFQNNITEARNALYFKPSQEAFKSLIAFVLAAKLSDNVDKNLAKWVENQPKGCIHFLQEPCTTVVKLNENRLMKNGNTIALCELPDLPAKITPSEWENGFFGRAGLLEQFIYKYWLTIYKDEVKIPTPINNDCVSDFLNVPHLDNKVQNGNLEPIAVVGMSCRFPSSNNVAEFWNLLIEARDGITNPPDYRWTKEQSIFQNPETRKTQAGFLTVPVDEFDAKFFGISPKEIIFIDPQHRLLHELVWEALEDGAIDPLDLNGTRTGVFMGSWRNDYYDILKKSASTEFYRGYMGNSIGAGAARISHFLGLTGPCVATESGCSAAMVAVHMACRSLQNGESNMALACGVNLLLHPFTTDIMPMVCAPDGHCKSFSNNADGFGRAEGCAVLVLKRLSDAVNDGDNICGVIKGSAMAQEGLSKSMGTPTIHCEAQAMRDALREANIHPSQVSYVESHGTGTIVGDPMEVAAIGRVYAEGRQEPLVIGSVKTNVGHTESCSGLTAIMKVLLSMKNEVIPPHRNYKELNPDINLDIIPAKLPLEPVKWPKIPGKPRVAGVSSFGITGTDSHVIVQEPPEVTNQRIVLKDFERPLHLMTVSARTEEALDILIEKYKFMLSSEDSLKESFANMAYTANVGRAKFNWRAAIVAKDHDEAFKILETNRMLRSEIVSEETTSRKVCFLFTGQGSQYHGMARELYETSPIFQMHFNRCQEILKTQHKIDLANAFWGKDENLINRTLYSQTGIFVVEYCLVKLWESWDVKPDYVLGHSLGEFGAAVCAGILTLEEALTLVAERSRLIDELPQGKMLVVKADKSNVDNLLRKFASETKDSEVEHPLDYAAINSAEQTVLAGDSEKIERLAEWLKGKDVKCSVLQSSHAFHSRHMDPILEEYRLIAKRIFKNKKITDLSCSYISGMLGKIVDVSSSPVDWPEYWVQHTREKVNFLSASKAVCDEAECRIFVEVGPHPVLTAFTMMNNEGKKQMMCLPSLRKKETDWSCLLNTVGKLFTSGSVEIDWKRFDQFYDRKKVGSSLPTYPFQGTKFWPNISSSSGVQIHPLLGSSVPNPTKAKIFENSISLQNLEYLKDHVIGLLPVFPGAGYMETLLMAGHVTLDGVAKGFRYPRRPIQLKDFRIAAPLGLDENSGCACQTVVEWSSSEDSNGGLESVFYHEMNDGEEGTSKWVKHASATFSPYNPSNNGVNIDDKQAYLHTMEKLKSTGKLENSAKEFYDKVADVGLKFGPAFRTLSKVWRGADSVPEFLAEVKIPKDAESYLVHPTLIDAMIQATVFHGEKSKKIEKKLRVPIGCERFVWFSPLKVETTEEDDSDEQNVCYIYSKGDSQTVVLLDKDGNLVAALNKLEAIETNAKSVQSLLESQVKAIPDMYKIDWKSTLGPSQRSLDFSLITDVVQVTENEPSDFSDYSEGSLESEIRRGFESLTSNYVKTAFINLGWTPSLEEIIELESFIQAMKIQPQHTQLIRQFLTYLELEGLLEKCNAKDTWKVKNLPDSLESLNIANEKIIQRISSTKAIDQALLLKNVGQTLDKILSGRESALRVLFPEDPTKPSAGKFYDSKLDKCQQLLYRHLCSIWESCKQAYQGKPLPVIRILEVGAGTGSITETILHSLETHGMHYEYIYSDISSSFFLAAEKRFKKYRKNIKFRKLNLEQDATSQGFAPEYFDFVVAIQVIHATRDVKEACLNVRQLIKNNGNFILCEMIEHMRQADCIFGLLEGYWRFTDLELRQNHATLTIDQWDQVGKLTGFSKMAYTHDFELAIISYRADTGETGGYEKLAMCLNEKSQEIQRQSRQAWILFYGDEEEKYVEELRKRLEFLGRRSVVLVKQTVAMDDNLQAGNDTPLQMHYKIRPGDKEDMENLIARLVQPMNINEPNGFSAVEGIVVLWGLADPDTRDQAQIARPFVHLVQSLFKLDKKLLPQVVVLTAGQYGLGDILCKNPSPSTLLGISKCVANEHSELRIRGIDVSPFELDTSIDEVFQEIFTAFNDEVAHFCAFRKGERLIPKVVPEKTIQRGGGALALPSSLLRYQLIHPKSKAIQDLEFGDLELFTLKPNEIEVQVKCSALNFKDILNILKPIEEFKDSNGVGFDFAGVVTAVGDAVTKRKIGDAVFGINIMGNALPSHIKLPEDAVASVPDSCTFTEAACFPAVFSTAYYCIINIAKANKGDTLLIHTASGGVGLLAIQIAKYFGLKIICTAGSERKRAYLRSLGVEHVFHSRNTSYGEEIMKATSGRGVNIVLNSLTGPGFKEATLQACAKGARFVEMSKLNIWTEEEVAEKRPDIQYTIIDLTKLDEDSSRKLLTESQQLLEKGVISPIPFTRYDAQNIRQALTYLQKAQHIGKVVVTMPEAKPGSAEMNQVYTPLFTERSTYLITGGLGGVGLEVCKYMVEQGARNIVLVGRKAPNEKAADVIGNLNGNRGCNVVVFQGDVGDWTQCQAIFQKMKDPSYNLPPLRGIMHCAGTLADALIENSKWEDFMSTYQAKVNGSWNLHELTKDTILEHFVLFSSVVASFGSPGQSTHSSACTFEDTMALYRNSHGLPATAINWGQFGQVGVAAEADIIAIRPFSAQQGINALDLILRENRNHHIVAIFDASLSAVVKYLPYSKRVIDEQVFKMTGQSLGKSKKLQVSSDQFWEEYNDSSNDRDGKVEIIKVYTKRLLRHVLRLDEDEPIDENMDLQDMGVDSLMMLELKNHLQEVLGDRVTITQSAMKDCNTVTLLSDRLVQIIEEEGEFTSVKPPTLEEVNELVVEDSKLPSEIQAQQPGSQKKPSEIKVVLFTGATGILGSHLLREMLEDRPQLEKMYCLVRTRGEQSPQEKLATVLERTLLMGKMKHFDKVHCISGNFVEDKLGMADDDYERLVNEVEAVVHCGAKVNHVEFYRNANGGRNDARSVNVGGIKKILEFCATSRTKHLLNTSTLLAITDVNENGTLSETWPDVENLSVTHNRGYQTSKYVCDLLLRQATLERGIPCKSFRFAELRGSRVTGQSLLESSHFMKSLLFFIKEGIMPELPIPANCLPIDLATKMATRVMFCDEAPNQTYNVSHPQPQLMQEYLPKLATELGHNIEILDTEEYRKRSLERMNDEGQGVKASLMSEFQDLYKDEEGMHVLFSGASPAVRKLLENVENFWLSKRLLKYVPDLYDQDKIESSYEINKRDLLSGKRDGLFEKLGL